MIGVYGWRGLLGSHFIRQFPDDTIPLPGDITNFSEVRDTLKNIQPTAVVNCAGAAPRSSYTKAQTFHINAIAPQVMGRMCLDLDIRLIQISTDCVFEGEGSNDEYDLPNATDWYGNSKSEGEYIGESHLVIRTSFVGYPDPNGRGLLAWFMRHTNDEVVTGYTRHIWNGLSTLALGKYLHKFAYSGLSGILHLHGQTITKYELLQTFNEVFGTRKRIIPVATSPVNRTLISRRKHEYTYIPGTSNFEEMMREMKYWQKTLMA